MSRDWSGIYCMQQQQSRLCLKPMSVQLCGEYKYVQARRQVSVSRSKDVEAFFYFFF